MAPLVALALQAVPSLIGMFDKDTGEKAEKVAGVVKSITGTDDHEKAAEALKDPAKLIQLKEALYAYQVKMAEEDTKRIQAVNETMRAESNAKNWWASAWRPFWGAVSAITFLVCAVGIMALAWKAISEKDHNAITMIPNLVMQMTLLFGVPGAILGVASWHRGKEKRIAAGEK